jgi:hypothetical protein
MSHYAQDSGTDSGSEDDDSPILAGAHDLGGIHSFPSYFFYLIY